MHALTIPDLRADLKAFFCALVDSSDLREPCVRAVIAERNARLLAERGAEGSIQ